MAEKQETTNELPIALDTHELLGLSQVASVSPDNTELSLTDLGRALCKKGTAEVPVYEKPE